MAVSLIDNHIYVDRQPFTPLGFNYWPPETGVECWRDECWSLDYFCRDFHAMAAMGFNCVRFFLRWPDFQPEEGTVNLVALERLRAVGEVAREAGIFLIPTLFVGFMSGGVYPPPWLGERNLFADPDCIRAAQLLATAAAQALAPYGMVLAYDLSNEINVWARHLPPATLAETTAWQRQMSEAIRTGDPNALVLNGTDHGGIVAETHWCLREQSRVPLDLLSMHVYPVQTWNPLKFGSLTCYEADTLAAVHVAMARAYGTVLLEEFGVAVPVSGACARDYLFQAVLGSHLAGSCGFLLWGWQDFTTRATPYRDNPFEKEICFRTAAGEVKEAGNGYLDALAMVRALDGYTPCPAQIGIFLGDAYWEGPHATLDNSLRCYWLSTTLRRLHLAHAFTETIDPRYRVLIVPGPRLKLDEIAALQAFVDGGGHVLLGNVGFNYWCDDLKALADVELVDMASLPGETTISAPGVELSVPGIAYFPVARPCGGSTYATIGSPAHPALLLSGNGRVATLFAPLGSELNGHPARLRYHTLLAPLFATWGCAPEAGGLDADIEARTLAHADGRRSCVLLNHGVEPFAGRVTWEGGEEAVEISAKGAVVLRAPVAVAVEGGSV